MVHSQLRRQLGILVAVAVLAVGLTAATGASNRVAADPHSTGTCAAATYPSTYIKLNAVATVHFGLTGRACTDGRIVWTFSSAYPSNCWVSYPRVLVVDGVCGYAGQLTTNFRYIEKITAKNYGGLAIQLAFGFLGVPPIIIPAGYQFPCTVSWYYTPADVTHGWTPAGYGSCGPMSPIW